jgi:DNA-binding response OmpR family regulator
VSGAGRILVVDDQEDIREMARLVLADAGFAVTTVPSGRDALRAVRAGAFDLVLLDINMPELDGWATLRLLREDDDLLALPVAMFSVKSEIRDKVAGLRDGAVDFITKPFGVDELVARVARILDAADPRIRPVPHASGS